MGMQGMQGMSMGMGMGGMPGLNMSVPVSAAAFGPYPVPLAASDLGVDPSSPGPLYPDYDFDHHLAPGPHPGPYDLGVGYYELDPHGPPHYGPPVSTAQHRATQSVCGAEGR
jgi:hypothetical protein